MLTLGIETATDVCSVALFEDDHLVADRTVSEPRSHAAQLVPLIQEIFRSESKAVEDVDVIAVSAGPGSYTGLRIGASTAKGLAFASDAALVAVGTLEALALGCTQSTTHYVLTVIPSRRDEVYAAIYDVSGPFPSLVQEPTAVELNNLADWLPEYDLHLAGPAANQVLEMTDSERLHFIDAAPSAIHVARIGIERFKNGVIENVAEWEPYYLKAFVAKPPRPIFG